MQENVHHSHANYGHQSDSCLGGPSIGHQGSPQPIQQPLPCPTCRPPCLKPSETRAAQGRACPEPLNIPAAPLMHERGRKGKGANLPHHCMSSHGTEAPLSL
eukprot:4142305-Amphidinium_carterae.2